MLLVLFMLLFVDFCCLFRVLGVVMCAAFWIFVGCWFWYGTCVNVDAWVWTHAVGFLVCGLGCYILV